MEKEINEAMNKVALRYGGIYLDVDKHNQDVRLYKPFVSLIFMMKNLAECGYTLSGNCCTPWLYSRILF